MNPIQHGALKSGPTVFLAGADNLTDKEGYLVKLVRVAGGMCTVELLDDPADAALFVVENGAASGEPVDVRPLEDGMTVKVRNGASAINGGDRVLANTGGTVLPRTGASADDYTAVGYAVEDVAAGALATIYVQIQTPLTVT